MSPTHQDLSNDTTFSQIKSRVPVPLRMILFSQWRSLMRIAEASNMHIMNDQ